MKDWTLVKINRLAGVFCTHNPGMTLKTAQARALEILETLHAIEDERERAESPRMEDLMEPIKQRRWADELDHGA